MASIVKPTRRAQKQAKSRCVSTPFRALRGSSEMCTRRAVEVAALREHGAVKPPAGQPARCIVVSGPRSGLINEFSYTASVRGCTTGCFRDKSPCSVCVFLTPVMGSGRTDRSEGHRVGTGMVMGSGFRGSHVPPASWVTSGPQFGMKLAMDRKKPSPIASAMVELVWRSSFLFGYSPGRALRTPDIKNFRLWVRVIKALQC